MSVLPGTFLPSMAALFVFIGSLSKGLFGDGTGAATEIFAPNELGTIEDPAATPINKANCSRRWACLMAN